MNSSCWKQFFALTFLAAVALAIPFHVAGQEQKESIEHKAVHHHYKLTDLGTFGGPNAYLPEPLNGIKAINNFGMVAGYADTLIPDPFAPNACLAFECLVNHTFEWRKGDLFDLGALPGVNNSLPNWINATGEIVGISENTLVDPATGFPEVRGVVWKNGRIIDLGTFGGNQSAAQSINDWGLVVGFTANTIAEPFPILLPPFAGTTQLRAFVWKDGDMRDLGTLGGNDAVADFVNNRGQVAGCSYTNTILDPVLGSPTEDPFLWHNGHMVDLGTLGGTNGCASSLNNRGQVVGYSFLAGNSIFHAFLWDQGVLKDLGTLGGNSSFPEWINDEGEIVGAADLPDGVTSHAALWKNGGITDLGTVDGDPGSSAFHINASGQVVGASQNSFGDSTHAFLWENGGPMIDLNALIPQNSGVQLISAPDINDRGEIVTLGVFPDGDQHAFLLTPCDEEHPGIEGCDYSLVDEATAAAQSRPAEITQAPAESLVKLSPAEIMTRFGFLRAGRNRSFTMPQTATKTALSGQAAISAPSVALSPTSLTFSTQAIGTTSAAEIVTLTNVGTAPFTIGGISITGTNAGDFAQTHTCGGSLAGGASCSISVTFKPTVPGTRTAALSVSDTAAGSPQQVALGGIGTTAKLFPTSIYFGSVTVGTTSSARTVTLTNVGTTTLTITGIAITGTNAGDFAQTHTCGSSLAAGASCSISVTFKPTATGLRTAALSVSDNAAGSPQTVVLTGGCIPQGGLCFGPSGGHCCPAPYPHHSYCSNPTGWGTCTES